jgi:septum formation protein
MTLVLASASPRRKVLLRFLVEEFRVAPVDIEEVAPHTLALDEAVRLIARKKAIAASQREPDAMVLAADTIVSYQQELVGKARDAGEARERLALLSGSTHQVWTGLALAWDGRAVDADGAVTAVHMDRLPREVLDAYVASGAWEGKAGAYGIQDRMLAPYLRVQAGPWSNVVGLPMARTAALLRRNRVACRDPPAESWLIHHHPFDGEGPAPA